MCIRDRDLAPIENTWDEEADAFSEAIFYEEVVPARRLELTTGELVPPPALRAEDAATPPPDVQPRPTTGSLNISQGLTPALAVAGGDAHHTPLGTAALDALDALDEHESAAVEAWNDEKPEGMPERLSVDDTMLVMGQTSLLRLSKMQQLDKRRTGYLYLAKPEEQKE